jgi:hypothetical protein
MLYRAALLAGTNTQQNLAAAQPNILLVKLLQDSHSKAITPTWPKQHGMLNIPGNKSANHSGPLLCDTGLNAMLLL